MARKPTTIITQSTFIYDLSYLGRITKATINGVATTVIDLDSTRDHTLEEVRRVRDALSDVLGDTSRGYDPEKYEEVCTHHVPCAGPCGSGLRRKRA